MTNVTKSFLDLVKSKTNTTSDLSVKFLTDYHSPTKDLTFITFVINSKFNACIVKVCITDYGYSSSMSVLHICEVENNPTLLNRVQTILNSLQLSF